MVLKNTSDSYGSISKFLHWLIFFLVLIQLTIGASFGYIAEKNLKSEIINIHKLIGLSILLFMLIRIVWLLINPKPALPASVQKWERITANTVYGLLYILLILMPLSGWIFSSASGRYPHFFHLFSIPFPVMKNKAIAEFFANMHFVLAWIVTILIVIHIAGALKHYFWDKDDVLNRMFSTKNNFP